YNAPLQEGRDYFSDTPLPGYTPYTYPHPLVTGNNPTPTPTAAPSPTSTPTPTAPIIINCGGPTYLDSGGQLWSADMDFAGGSTFSTTHSITGTSDPTLYQTERYAPTLTYNIPVVNDTYTVTLYFAEIYFNAPGQRVFNVSIEGQTVLQNFDIWAVAGQFAAVQRTFVVTVTDGVLNIVGTASVNNAKFSAIQVVPGSSAPTPTPTPISFTAPTPIATLTAPTQAAWGPDGRLYVGSDQGNITIYTFADDYTITDTQVVTTIAQLSNKAILGLAFNPADPPSPVKIYVGHAHLYAEGGGAFTGSAPYNGQISVLTGPNFSSAGPLITGLPVSNHDHAIN